MDGERWLSKTSGKTTAPATNASAKPSVTARSREADWVGSCPCGARRVIAATSAPVCITSITPTIRFFSRTNGTQGGAVLRVDALFKNARGKIQSLPVGAVAGRQAWGPTLPTRLLLNAMAAVSKQSALGVA